MLEFLEKSRHVLGMNARILSYMRPSNSLRAIRIADNKLLAKKILGKNGLPVLQNYAVIKDLKDLKEFNWDNLPNSFTLKPNRGMGGEGILIVYARRKKYPNPWIKADKKIITANDLETHILNILEGTYSITSIPDVAFFEERIRLLKLFKPYS